jgi:hypothetical protein
VENYEVKLVSISIVNLGVLYSCICYEVDDFSHTSIGTSLVVTMFRIALGPAQESFTRDSMNVKLIAYWGKEYV